MSVRAVLAWLRPGNESDVIVECRQCGAITGHRRVSRMWVGGDWALQDFGVGRRHVATCRIGRQSCVSDREGRLFVCPCPGHFGSVFLGVGESHLVNGCAARSINRAIQMMAGHSGAYRPHRSPTAPCVVSSHGDWWVGEIPAAPRHTPQHFCCRLRHTGYVLQRFVAYTSGRPRRPSRGCNAHHATVA